MSAYQWWCSSCGCLCASTTKCGCVCIFWYIFFFYTPNSLLLLLLLPCSCVCVCAFISLWLKDIGYQANNCCPFHGRHNHQPDIHCNIFLRCVWDKKKHGSMLQWAQCMTCCYSNSRSLKNKQNLHKTWLHTRRKYT